MKLKDNPKAYAIMGCAMRVHSALGPGFLESAYGDALEVEFANAGIPFVREDEVRVFYGGKPLKTTYRADFTCFEKEFIVELKAVRTITKVDWAQVIHYMRATRIKNALLVNFGRGRLQYDTFDLDRLPTASVLDGSATTTTCSESLAKKAAEGLTPMIGAPATAPQAGMGLADFSPDAIPSQNVSCAASANNPKNLSCAVSRELGARRATILRSGSESSTARSISERAAAEGLTPMIDALATASQAGKDFAHSSRVSIPSQNVSCAASANNPKDCSCAVNGEWNDRSKTILRSGTAERSETAGGRESHTARSFSNNQRREAAKDRESDAVRSFNNG